jgi:NAD-dependent dihydropyrimidine dehydrogenase PreA subunit
MPYVISDACVDSKDMSCVDVCPVDCIYEGKTRLWIQPSECIDCGACEAVCPVTAISYVDAEAPTPELNEATDFFTTVLPGREEPLGAPGGAAAVGPLETDLPRLLALGDE